MTYKDRRGTTMIEVLVALVVVLFITMVFSRVVTSSVRMLSMATETISETEKFNEEYYKSVNYNNRAAKAGNLKLVVDKDKTQDNTAQESTLNLNNECKMVFWAADNGYSMYAVAPKGYGSVTPPTSPSADPGDGTDPDPSPDPEPSSDPEPTPDPANGTGEKLEVLADEKWEGIYDYNDWNEIQEALEEASHQPNWEHRKQIDWHLENGYVWLIDGKAYVSAWFQGIVIDADDTPETIIEKYSQYFIEITKDTRVFTSKEIINENGIHFKDPIPKQGDLYWDGTDFWLLRQNIDNGYNLPQGNEGCWQKILQPPRESKE